MKTETLTLPEFWASALINDDCSGFDENDEKNLNDFLADRPELGACLDCSQESHFAKYHDANAYVLATSCLEFTFEVKGNAK